MRLAYQFFVLTIATSITLINAKKLSTCREPAILQDFDVTRVLGKWYEYSRHRHDFEDGCDCLSSEVAAVDSSHFQISNCCQMSKVSNVTQKCNIGVDKLILTDPEKKEASFQFTRPGVTVDSHVWIIDTDYDNFMVVNGCEYVSDDEERELFWILSRDRQITAKEVQKIDAILRAHKFERSKIIKQKQGVKLCTAERP